MRTLASLLPVLALAQPRKKLIIDTDLYSDVDDAAALLLALTHHQSDLLAVITNYPSVYTPLAASAIIGHYSNHPVPIGARRPLHDKSFLDIWDYELGEYASKVAWHWRDRPNNPLRWDQVDDAHDPVELYRTVLANTEEQITIVSIGFLENLSALLNSTSDAISPLSGPELIRSKVSEFVVMGGEYPCGREFNFFGDDPGRAAHVINTWAVLGLSPVVYVGLELGKKVLTGMPLMTESPSLSVDPVGAAYKWYTYGKPRESWDPIAVLYAIEGKTSLFEFGNAIGYNKLGPDGSNSWVKDDGVSNQHWLTLKVNNVTVATDLDELYLEGARKWAFAANERLDLRDIESSR